MSTLVAETRPSIQAEAPIQAPPTLSETPEPSHREVHYEVWIKRDARWVIETVNRSRGGAINDARRILQLGDYAGVRVTKEVANRETGAAAALVVFEHVVATDHLKRSLLKGFSQPAARQPAAHEPAIPDLETLDRSWFEQPIADTLVKASKPTKPAKVPPGPKIERSEADLSWRRVTAGILITLGFATATAVLLAIVA